MLKIGVDPLPDPSPEIYPLLPVPILINDALVR
jgi:hypothetical protein